VSRRLLPFLACAFLAATARGERPFDVRRDTFSFANETVFAYDVDAGGTLHIGPKDKPPAYAHRCFVMSRAVIQFHRFAHFAPEQRRVSREEYARLVRRLSRIPVWSTGPRERIVVPGFRDLRDFSATFPTVLQEHLGAWFPSYVRVGNYRMAMGHLRSGQAAASRWLADSIGKGKLCAVYLARFPRMNHCVVVYSARPEPSGDIHFLIYDPNYPGQPASLDYLAAERSFSLAKRWYFPGGRVNLMRVYISPFH
jgi:hypothetical protein